MRNLKIIRDDEHRWILQKNINSKIHFINYLKALADQKNELDFKKLMHRSKFKYSYSGRSDHGSANTMGVRMSEVNFYMFGYKSSLSNEFIPTPISDELIKGVIQENRLFLANITMMQYPHPNSTTANHVDLFYGRFILKLLTDGRIDKKLFTDELIYIIPFITSMNTQIYEDVIIEIINYRKLSYKEKKHLFDKVENSNALFAKITHEILYYFIRICENFNVLETYEDKNHNEGKVFSFQQGNTKTYRRTAIKSRGKYQGYVVINPKLIDLVDKILRKFTFDSTTYKLGHGIYTEEELHNDMFITQSYRLLNTIAPNQFVENNIVNKLEDMRKYSINSPDGKMFEYALEKVFKEFDEAHSVNILSGAGQTDMFCVFYIDGKLEQFNVEAKSGSSGNNVNVVRIMRHLDLSNADYCLMISPRFSRGTYLDIANTKISTITTETLYQYCMRMLTQSQYRQMPYVFIHNLVKENPGSKLDYKVEEIITQRIKFNT